MLVVEEEAVADHGHRLWEEGHRHGYRWGLTRPPGHLVTWPPGHLCHRCTETGVDGAPGHNGSLLPTTTSMTGARVEGGTPATLASLETRPANIGVMFIIKVS